MNKDQLKIKEKISNFKIPIKFKPNKNDYVDNNIPLKRTYCDFKIEDCTISNFKKDSKIRNYMESISDEYKLKENNLELVLINNPEWYDSFEVEKIN